MAHILFVTWPGGGNQGPALGMARELQQRGHSVTFAGYEVQRARFEASGFRFILLGRSAAAYRPDGELKTLLATVFAAADHLRDVPEAVSRTGCECLVVDCLQFGALAAAEDAGLPAAVLVHTTPGLIAAPATRMDTLLRAPVNAMRVDAGKPPISTLWDAWAGFLTLCATVMELDPLATQVPSFCAYVGPIFEHPHASNWHDPWAGDDPRPLVLASFSTLWHWDQTSRIQRTLAALAERPCRVLVTMGSVNPNLLAAPENAVLVPYLPHAEVMSRAAVCVTHAGHGTVTAALAAGMPLVCLPNNGADQMPLSAQVEALGAGRALDGEACTPAEIAAAVEQVLTEPSYAISARRLGRIIAGSPGATNAASRLEAYVEQSGGRT
ncbi:MAG TPA: glycosyltransferase [Ktedonobacterales bacterium]